MNEEKLDAIQNEITVMTNRIGNLVYEKWCRDQQIQNYANEIAALSAQMEKLVIKYQELDKLLRELKVTEEPKEASVPS